MIVFLTPLPSYFSSLFPGDGTIDTACIGDCLRVMGFCPTEEELAHFVSSGGGEGAFVDYNYVKVCFLLHYSSLITTL